MNPVTDLRTSLLDLLYGLDGSETLAEKAGPWVCIDPVQGDESEEGARRRVRVARGNPERPSSAG